ncbi:MAG: tetratricopeptide repeat protein [Myxococcota bacterium]|nr:tetratricopeptide repeat protein [Myxococcota bacterium]
MSETQQRSFDLDAVRTDGWFERIGEGIGSFQALCEIVGERFFAFSVIVGARITALTVDRRTPDLSLVDFVVGVPDGDEGLEPQRLTLADFRRRLVGALLVEDDRPAPDPARETEIEAIQLFVGVRYLLLAPLYGYSLRRLLLVEGHSSQLVVLHDGVEETHELDAFRFRIRALVREELERVATGSRSAIDLAKVIEAEAASRNGEWPKVVQLLGSWPAPLAIYLRTPEGQLLTPEARAIIAKGLGLLGSACVHLGEIDQAEEVFRIGIQYAQEGVAAADLFRRLGEALLENDRPGEAIGPFRRALAFGGSAAEVMPSLSRAFLKRKKWVAAYACLREAFNAGVGENEVLDDLHRIESALGLPLTGWKAATFSG